MSHHLWLRVCVCNETIVLDRALSIHMHDAIASLVLSTGVPNFTDPCLSLCSLSYTCSLTLGTLIKVVLFRGMYHPRKAM